MRSIFWPKKLSARVINAEPPAQNPFALSNFIRIQIAIFKIETDSCFIFFFVVLVKKGAVKGLSQISSTS